MSMKAVGASIRIFDLLDRIPDVPTENGDVLYQLDGSKLIINEMMQYKRNFELAWKGYNIHIVSFQG